MVNFYRNSSYTKHESHRFSLAVILCIPLIRVLLCSAIPIVDETTTIDTAEAEVIKALSELSPETRKNIEDFIQEQGNRTDGYAGDLGIDNLDDIAEGNGEEEANEYYDETSDTVKTFTELKTTTVPTKPTRPTRRHDDDDDYDKELEEDSENSNEGVDPIEISSTTTTTTEEPITRVPLKESTEEYEHRDTSISPESKEFELASTTTLIRVPNSSLTLKSYSFFLFIPVLLCICLTVS